MAPSKVILPISKRSSSAKRASARTLIFRRPSRLSSLPLRVPAAASWPPLNQSPLNAAEGGEVGYSKFETFLPGITFEAPPAEHCLLKPATVDLKMSRWTTIILRLTTKWQSTTTVIWRLSRSSNGSSSASPARNRSTVITD